MVAWESVCGMFVSSVSVIRDFITPRSSVFSVDNKFGSVKRSDSRMTKD